MLEPTFRLVDAKFDAKPVKRAVDRGADDAIPESLRNFQQRLISTYRRGSGPSRPGQPPNVHSTNRYANLKNVDVSYDRQTKTGVAGAIKLPRSKPGIPGLLESGGIIKYNASRRRDGTPGKPRTVRIKARPAVSVAFKQSINRGEIAGPFAGSIKG